MRDTLLIDPHHPRFSRDFLPAYDWMRDQMAQRLPSYAGHYPWWAYEYFLDLRFYRWHATPPGQRLIRLELAVPRSQVLLSAYGSWHSVLGRKYLPEGVEEGVPLALPGGQGSQEAVTVREN